MLLTIFSGLDRTGHGGQAFEHVGQVGFRLVALTFGAFDEGVDDGDALTGGFSADEQPVLFPYGCEADVVFDKVVVDLNFAVLDKKAEPVPEGEGAARDVDAVAGSRLSLPFFAAAGLGQR